MFRKRFVYLAVLKFLACSFIYSAGAAEPLLVAGDPIIPVGEVIGSNSSYPAAEGPGNVLDGNSNTKYLNFGRLGAGFIVTPAGGAATLGSVNLTTANDSPDRDPTTIEVYGTNEPILSVDNSVGQAESWTPLASENLALSDNRLTVSEVISLNITAAYTSYKVIFGNTKGVGNSMQIADVNFYQSLDASGSSFLVPGSPIIAVQEQEANFENSESSSPDFEGVDNLLDGSTATKYLNFGKENTGFIVTPSAGSSVVRAFTLSTANDFEGRDPVNWELFGTNDAVITVAHQSGLGREAWTLIGTGTLALPADREIAGSQVIFNNNDAFTSYKWICRTLKDTAGTEINSVQFSEFQFDCDPTLNQLPLEVQKLTFLPNGTQIQLDWTGAGGSTHLLQFSTDLVDWSYEVDDSLDPDEDNPYLVNIVDLPVSAKGFFRFVKPD
ncbi:hypothetical protein OAK94_00675 [bacterium]|nr:hypothetical protein [Akkermansiaceae bacterium]MDC0270197.1 hypothetical protein [bacterium]